MAQTTYTMLITIAHDDGAALSTDLLDVMVKRGLEEGVREMHGVEAADADSVVGDFMGVVRQSRDLVKVNEKMLGIRTLHNELRKP